MNQEGVLESFKQGRILAEPLDTNQKRRVQLDLVNIQALPGDLTQPGDLNFTWTLLNYTKTEMEIKLHFQTPLAVSSTQSPDRIQIKIKGEGIFVDRDGFSLDQETTLIRDLPPQFDNEATQAAFEVAAIAIQSSQSGILGSNFLLTLLMGASLQFLWDMVNAQQIVILMPLFGALIPENINSLFSSLMLIAAFELFPTDWIYSYASGIEGRPQSPKFEELGFEHHLVINNLGSLGVIAALLPFAYLVSQCVLPIWSRFRCCRRCSKRINSKLFWSAPLRVVLESNIIGLICCLLNLRVIDFSTEEDKWTQVNAIITILVLPVFLLFPVFATIFLCRNLEELSKSRSSLSSHYGEMVLGFNKKERSMVVYWSLEQFRRVILCFSVVYSGGFLWLQFFAMIMTSVAMLIATGHTKARERRFDQSMDYFNELKLIILMYHMMLFTEFVPEAETRFHIGYSCCVALLISIAVNMIGVILEPFHNSKRSCQIRFAKRQAIKRRQLTRKPRQQVTKQFQQRRLKDALDNKTSSRLSEQQSSHEQESLDASASASASVSASAWESQLSPSMKPNSPSSSIKESRQALKHSAKRLINEQDDQWGKEIYQVCSTQVLPLNSTKLDRSGQTLNQKYDVFGDQFGQHSSGNDAGSMAGMQRVRARPLISEPLGLGHSLTDTRATKKVQIAQVGNPHRARQPKQLTWDDLEYFWQNYGLTVGMIQNVPGYEDFEVVDEISDRRGAVPIPKVNRRQPMQEGDYFYNENGQLEERKVYLPPSKPHLHLDRYREALDERALSSKRQFALPSNGIRPRQFHETRAINDRRMLVPNSGQSQIHYDRRKQAEVNAPRTMGHREDSFELKLEQYFGQFQFR